VVHTHVGLDWIGQEITFVQQLWLSSLCICACVTKQNLVVSYRVER